MQGSWIKKTLSLILTLTLVIGVCGMLPAGALANTGEYQLNPKSTSVDAGGQKTFAVEAADAAATPANVPVKYVWSVSGGSLVSGGGETDATATYQFDSAGSASVSCALYASAEPDATAFETPSSSITVNAVTPVVVPEANPEPAAPAEASQGTVNPTGSGSLGLGALSLTAGTAGVEITNKKDEFLSKNLTKGYSLGLNVAPGFKIISATWSSTSPTVIKPSKQSTSGATLVLGSVGMGADPFTITVDCVLQDLESGSIVKSVIDSFEVTSVTPTIRFTTPESEMSVDQTRTVTVEKFPASAQVVFESSSDAVTVDPTAATTGATNKLTAKEISDSEVKITAKFLQMESVSAEYSISKVTGKNPGLAWKSASANLTRGKSLDLKNYLKYPSGVTPEFVIDPESLGTLEGGVLTANSDAAGVIKVTATSEAVSPYKAGGPVTMLVYVGTNSRITASPSTMKLGVNGSDLAAITKTTGTDMDWIITSSNSSVADAELSSGTDPDADTAVLSVNGYKTGTATITLRSEGSTQSATIHVTVGTPTAGMKVNFFANDNKTQTLTPAHAWGTMQVTVANFNPTQPYVTLTRSNIRTYVRDGGSLASHPSPNSWIARLTPNAEDPTIGEATLYVVGQYNGNTTYSASYVSVSGATAIPATSPTIYVTGFSALPQTGPDYTWAYVLGGLCLAAIATAITLNVKRKKKQQDN